MPSSFQSKILIDTLEVIDWYDGVVTGLVRFERDSGWFYVSLLARDVPNDQKIFAVVRIDGNIAQSLKKLIKGGGEDDIGDRWDAIQREVQRLKIEVKGIVRIIKCKEFGEASIDEAELEIDDDQNLRANLGQDVEATFNDDNKIKWFGHRLWRQ